MRNTAFILAFAILGTGLAALLLFGGSGPIAGIDQDQFARLTYLGALAVLIGAGVVAGRGRMSPRLWHVAVWLGLAVALMVGYRAFA